MQEWILAQHGPVVYGAILFLLLSGAVGLPVPEDLPLLLSGVLIHAGTVRWELIFAVCYAGIILGDLFIFFIGRHFGKALYRKEWFRARIGTRQMVQIQRGLEKRSLLMIFVARHLFYLRTVTFLTCGILKISFTRFLVADAIAALISAPLMIGLGYFAAEHYDAAIAFLAKAKWVSVILGLAALAAFGLWWRHHKRIVAEEASAAGEVSLDGDDATRASDEARKPGAN